MEKDQGGHNMPHDMKFCLLLGKMFTSSIKYNKSHFYHDVAATISLIFRSTKGIQNVSNAKSRQHYVQKVASQHWARRCVSIQAV